MAILENYLQGIYKNPENSEFAMENGPFVVHWFTYERMVDGNIPLCLKRGCNRLADAVAVTMGPKAKWELRMV